MTTAKRNPLALWDTVSKTDPAYTKKQEFGARLTAINATYQIKMATTHWGPFGGTWGLSDDKFTKVKMNEIYYCDYEGVFFCPLAKFNTYASIEYIKSSVFDRDYRKKLQTDALTKALSKLGFNSDVFMGMFDDDLYVSSRQLEMDESQMKNSDLVKIKKYIKEEDALNYYTLMLGLSPKVRLMIKEQAKTKDTVYAKLQKEGRKKLTDIANVLRAKIDDKKISKEDLAEFNEDTLNKLGHMVAGLEKWM